MWRWHCIIHLCDPWFVIGLSGFCSGGMETSVCLDCAILPFNSLWLQCHKCNMAWMENSCFPERLKTANPVNWNYLLLKVIMPEHLRKRLAKPWAPPGLRHALRRFVETRVLFGLMMLLDNILVAEEGEIPEVTIVYFEKPMSQECVFNWTWDATGKRKHVWILNITVIVGWPVKEISNITAVVLWVTASNCKRTQYVCQLNLNRNVLVGWSGCADGEMLEL